MLSNNIAFLIQLSSSRHDIYSKLQLLMVAPYIGDETRYGTIFSVDTDPFSITTIITAHMIHRAPLKGNSRSNSWRGMHKPGVPDFGRGRTLWGMAGKAVSPQKWLFPVISVLAIDSIH